MRIESKLCFVSEDKAIVLVNGWINDQNVGSALAEGPTVEIAEDSAISRLNKRLKRFTNQDDNINLINEEKIKTNFEIKLPNSDIINDNNINNEPEDWSNELTEIDIEIKRLKWSRDDEINFLFKTFGYNNRNKITKYDDIVKYLELLKKIDRQLKSDVINDNFNRLIAQSDSILMDLSWDHIQGRDFLKKEFNVSTRKELSEKQLISFIEKLKLIQNQKTIN